MRCSRTSQSSLRSLWAAAERNVMSRKYMQYEHVVYTEDKDGKKYLCIDRLFSSGRRQFMTHQEIPPTNSETEGFDLMGKTAEWLGNSMLIDSPAFRRHIGIEDENS
tara:strand:- start:7121 stop:7441 length:321 start_codon:yes stop_codon:yes gene_type:complete